MAKNSDFLSHFIRKQIDEAEYACLAIIKNFAYFAQVMILNPFCDKHGLKFIQGMGAFTLVSLDPTEAEFFDCNDWDAYIDGNYGQYGDDHADQCPPDDYVVVREVLNINTWQGALYEHMADYNPTAQSCTVEDPCLDTENCTRCKTFPSGSGG